MSSKIIKESIDCKPFEFIFIDNRLWHKFLHLRLITLCFLPVFWALEWRNVKISIQSCPWWDSNTGHWIESSPLHPCLESYFYSNLPQHPLHTQIRVGVKAFVTKCHLKQFYDDETAVFLSNMLHCIRVSAYFNS